jgi:two-component system sensor histidine kinase TctE
MRLRAAVEARATTDLADFEVDQVHKEVRPLVAAMNGYMGRLQALIVAQRRFIADASHQLRTPLTVLKTQAELALRELDRNPNDPRAWQDLRDIVAGMAGTTDTTVHLANRLLTLARAEHGAVESGIAPVSLTDVTRQVGLEQARGAVNKQIDLSFDAVDQLIVNGNALLLHELISNLLDNAIRYTPTGGKIVLRVRRDGAGRRAILEVEDSGMGIAEEDRERVFSAFYRAPSAQQQHPGGAGLGLSIVRDIASAHQAQIALSAADGGKGSASGLKVTLSFPLPLKS